MRPNAPTLTMLGLETTCDETAAAVVRLTGERPEVLAEVAYDQFARHAPFGGVVPEIAARAHAEKIDHAVAAALAQAGIGFDGLDGVAASAGPGLIGGVMVGLVAAKAIALARGLPLIAVNHLEGHALSPRLGEPLAFPYLLLLVSGGHCQFLAVEGLGRYQRLGSTIDDAAGEAFDKAAKLLGLPQPGGPAIERAARAASAPERFALPRPLVGRPGCDLSFAGLKTALWRHVERLGALSDGDRADLAAAFQSAVVDCLAERAGRALERFAADHGAAGGLRFVAAGGVAANGPLRARLAGVAEAAGARFVAPPLRYCTDNGAMIALAGGLRLAAGLAGDPDAPARPRWPLDEAAARDRPTHKPGRKGAKA